MPNRFRTSPPTLGERLFSSVVHSEAQHGVGARGFIVPSLAVELGALLTLSVLFPFLIHILPVPEDARLGPKLLPMFYAPLLAALLGRKQSAWLVALGAPWLNWLVTSHPTPLGAVTTSLELVVFVVALRLLLRHGGPRWYWALPAYATCMLVAACVGAVLPVLLGGRPALPWLAQSVVTALPGIAILVGVNWLVVRTYPTGSDGEGPTTA